MYSRAEGGGSTSTTEPTVVLTFMRGFASEGARFDFFAAPEWITDEPRLSLPSGRSVPCVFL